MSSDVHLDVQSSLFRQSLSVGRQFGVKVLSRVAFVTGEEKIGIKLCSSCWLRHYGGGRFAGPPHTPAIPTEGDGAGASLQENVGWRHQDNQPTKITGVGGKLHFP